MSYILANSKKSLKLSPLALSIKKISEIVGVKEGNANLVDIGSKKKKKKTVSPPSSDSEK